MDIQFNTDPHYQYLYYIDEAYQIASGHFQRIRACLLPYRTKDTWYLPDIGLFSQPELVQKILTKPYEKLTAAEDEVLRFVATNCHEIASQQTAAQDQKRLNEIKDQLVIDLHTILIASKKIAKVILIPTEFGTASSNFIEGHPNSQTIYVTYRTDKGIVYGIYGLLSAIIYISKIWDDTYDNRWRNRTAISDFIVHHTKLYQYFEQLGYNSQSSRPIDIEDGELAEQSASYYAKLGYPLTSMFSYDPHNIYFNKQPLQYLEPRQFDILKILIQHKSRVVSFDTIGELYWKDKVDDKFSLEALAKVIEKLRDTLERNNIPSNLVKTARKRGYLLYD